MNAALIALSGISVFSMCFAGATYALSFSFRKQRNAVAARLADEKQAHKDTEMLRALAQERADRLQVEAVAFKVDRQQNWVPKPKREHGKFVKAVSG